MAHSDILRLMIFVALFAVFAVLERIAPRRGLHHSTVDRWATNAAIMVLGAILLRGLALLLPLLAIGAALDAAQLGWGLLNATSWNPWVQGVLAFLILDLAIWAQDLITHKVPILWRFHRVHHADGDFDVTTAIRFHPVEIAASMLVKIGVIYALGPPALAVLVFEVALNGTALFNHANLAIPRGLDRILRLVLVTPDMHRVHHSTERSEHDTNFGFCLSVWDRIFRTFRAQPAKGHVAMTIGLQWQDNSPTRLGWTLLLPFRR